MPICHAISNCQSTPCLRGDETDECPRGDETGKCLRNIALKLRFDGTNYHGFQRQNNSTAIQNVLENRLNEILNEDVLITGCSRTDAGVHAREFVCNFKSETNIPATKLINAINGGIPDDIAVYDAWDADDEFSARFSALGKTYAYRIWNEKHRDPLVARYSYHVPQPLDIAKMKLAAAQFVGTYDYRAFMNSSNIKDVKKMETASTIRDIDECSVEECEGMVVIGVKGKSYLYNMVRIMAGTLIAVGRGKILHDDIAGIIQSGERAKAGPTAPPQGLCLEKVYY